MRTVSLVLASLGAAFISWGLTITSTQTTHRPSSSSFRSFNRWRSLYNKTYRSPAEASYRSTIFAYNIESIDRHAIDSSYRMNVNMWSDVSSDEFNAMINAKSNRDMYSISDSAEKYLSGRDKERLLSSREGSDSKEFDWRGYLQQQSISTGSRCNSAYAWVAAVNMNANFYLSHDIPNHYAFSPQTYLDCSDSFGNQGCQGGSTTNCYEYSKLWGIDTLQNYPYFDQSKACTASKGFFRNVGVVQVSFLSNAEVLAFLSRKYILTVLVDISAAQFYSGGVFDGPCSTEGNQALILTGIGHDASSGKDYWSAMNTWSSNWGEQGFIRLQRYDIDNDVSKSSCGLNMYAHFPSYLY